MFTQCYKCETVFRLSAGALRAAGGQVRCGHCGEVFSALARLADDASGYGRGETSLDMEVRVDELLETAAESTAPQAVAVANDTEVAQLRVLEPPDDALTSEASLEFTLPPGELDRIFIETTPSVLKLLSVEADRRAAASKPAPQLQRTSALESAEAGSARPKAAPAHAASSSVEIGRPDSEPAIGASSEAGIERPVPEHAAAEPLPSDAGAAAAAERPQGISGLEISDDALQEMLAGYTHVQQPQLAKPRRRVSKFAWLTAAIVLALLLAAQVMLANRDWWAAYVPMFGGAAAPRPNLAAYATISLCVADARPRTQ